MTAKKRFLTGVLDSAMIAATSDWVQGLAAQFGLSHEDAYRADLCLAELVTNVVHHAEPQFAGSPLEIHAAIDDMQMSFTVVDSAQAFDPLSLPPPPAAATIEAIRVGGQGIPLVREFSDACAYERSHGRNRLRLLFDLTAPAPRAGASVARKHDRREGRQAPAFPLQLRDGLEVARERRGSPDRRAKGYLSLVEMFRVVPYAALEALVDRFPIRRVAATTTVLKRGERNREVLIVLDGTLKVYLDQLGAGDFIEIGSGGCVGEMSVIDNQAVSAHVVAEPGTELLVVDAASFLNDVMAIPGVSRNLMAALSERMRRSNDQLIRRLRKELELESVQRELQYARSIQKSLLPKEPLFPGEPRLDCVGRMVTAREVGGDFYDAFALDPHRIFFVIADVCGKGLPAALFMVRAMAALRAQGGGEELPGTYTEQLVSRLNRQLCDHNDAKQFLTAFCGILDLGTMTIHYVNAGHNPPLLAIGDAPFAYLEEPINPIVGMIETLEYRSGSVTLTPGSVLFLYTDGVTEAEDKDLRLLGEDRLLAHLNDAQNRRSADLVDAVFAEVTAFAGDAPQSDDITVLAIRIADAPLPASRT